MRRIFFICFLILLLSATIAPHQQVAVQAKVEYSLDRVIVGFKAAIPEDVEVKVKNHGGSSSPSDEVSETPSATVTKTLKVSSITMNSQKISKNYKINTVVTVVDAATNNAVSGATVYLTMRLPNGGTWSKTGITNSQGTVTFTYGPTKTRGTYTSQVTNVALSGWIYDNQQPTATLTV